MTVRVTRTRVTICYNNKGYWVTVTAGSAGFKDVSFGGFDMCPRGFGMCRRVYRVQG